jgi:hypothetical protein
MVVAARRFGVGDVIRCVNTDVDMSGFTEAHGITIGYTYTVKGVRSIAWHFNVSLEEAEGFWRHEAWFELVRKAPQPMAEAIEEFLKTAPKRARVPRRHIRPGPKA